MLLLEEEEEEQGAGDAKVLSPVALVTLDPSQGVCLCPELPSVNLDQGTSLFLFFCLLICKMGVIN